MRLQTLPAERFVRRTQLGRGEYRKNFRQVDAEVIAALTSREADAVTPLMSKVYLRMVNAPARYWEREGVLRFEGEPREEAQMGAWEALCETLGVASATARKALRWMHEQGIIGYFSGKNGVGLRIFLNRAASSIGSRAASQKILEFPRASSREGGASQNEAAFSDSYADLETLETDLVPPAPKEGAEQTRVGRSAPASPAPAARPHRAAVTTSEVPASAAELTELLLARLEPAVRAAAAQAAAREHERTREWLESKGLPKAARVAQRETFDALRRQGVISEAPRGTRAEVGSSAYTPPEPHALSQEEVLELAEACAALYEAKGQSVEATLAEMSAAAGGFLLPEDAPRVLERASALLAAGRGHV